MRLPCSEAVFLERYWQQKPVLLPQALPNFNAPLSPEELAELAMEPEVSSRIVTCSNGVWEKADGPFAAQDFQKQATWTLLVDNVDRWNEAVRRLLGHVSFLPTWRFDDVMISFAVDGAGVGPHFDRYDVFLLQGLGEREWHIGPRCDEHTPQMHSDGLSLIAEFEPAESYTLRQGDVLYVPPGVAHWGIARGECMTYSLGFRAPRISDLVARRADSVLERLAETTLLEDGYSISTEARPGEITRAHVANALDAIANASDALDDRRWFGEVVTEQLSEDDEAFESPAALQESLGVRLISVNSVAWSAYSQHVEVFVKGETFLVPLTALESLMALCAGGSVSYTELSADHPELFDALVMQNVIEPG